MISQLCEQSSPCFDKIYRTYLAHGNGKRRPDDETLTNILTEMLTLLEQEQRLPRYRCFDECS